MEITLNNWERFFKLRQKVFDMIREIDEGYHKSYEGAVDVRFCFKNIYEAENLDDLDFVEIELHCYLLINGRHKTFRGKDFETALDSFGQWVEIHETEGE